MVEYATADDVRSAVAPDPEHRSGTAATMSDTALQVEVRTAQSEVDAKLRGRYRVPMDPTPDLVKSVTVAIAGYLATLTYRRGKDLADTDPIARRYRWAQDMLKAVVEGKADLDTGDGGASAPSTSGGTGRPINRRGAGLLTAGMEIDETGGWYGW